MKLNQKCYLITLFFMLHFVVVRGQSLEVCTKEAKEVEIGQWITSKIDGNNSSFPECIFDYSAALTKFLVTNCSNISDARINLIVNVSDSVNRSQPLIFIIRQSEQVKVIKLPFNYNEDISFRDLLNGDKETWYYESAGTLCINSRKRDFGKLFITVETASGNGITDFSFRLDAADGMNLRLGHKTTTDILSPTKSTFYLYSFDNVVRNVTVIVRAIGKNAPCTVVSLQDPYCPVLDVQETAYYEGRFNNMLNLSVKFLYQGELTNQKNFYAEGFVVVIIVLDDDKLCRKKVAHDTSGSVSRDAQFSVEVLQSPWDSEAEHRFGWYFEFLLIILGLIISIILTSLSWECFSRNEMRPRRPRSERGMGPDGKPYHQVGQYHFASGNLRQQKEVIVMRELYLDEFILFDHRAELQTFFTKTLHYIAAIFFVVLFHAITLTTNADLSDCFYNKLCTYHASLFQIIPLTFYMFNSVVSSLLAHAFCGGGFLIFTFLKLNLSCFPRRPSENEPLAMAGDEMHLIDEDDQLNVATNQQNLIAADNRAAGIQQNLYLGERAGEVVKQPNLAGGVLDQRDLAGEMVDQPDLTGEVLDQPDLTGEVATQPDLESEVVDQRDLAGRTIPRKRRGYILKGGEDAEANRPRFADDELDAILPVHRVGNDVSQQNLEPGRNRQNLAAEGGLANNDTHQPLAAADFFGNANAIRSYGIGVDKSIDQALGGLQVLMGILAAMYHVCPNVVSHQIDQPVLTLIIVLVWIKVHRLRYPSYSSTGWIVSILVLKKFFELSLTLGSFYDVERQPWFASMLVFLVVAYMFLAVLHCFYIYHLGYIRIRSDNEPIPNASNEIPKSKIVLNIKEMFCIWLQIRKHKKYPRKFEDLENHRKLDFWLVVLVFLVNIVPFVIVVLYLCKVLQEPPEEFSQLILDLILANVAFTVFLHLLRKCYHEGLHITYIVPFTFFCISIIFYTLERVFFKKSFDWKLTYAESRDLNRPCVLGGVYDTHDYFHFFKAMWIFCMNMCLSTMNDGVNLMERKHVKVF